MEKVRSADGTSIAYERSGAGAPLILVHGTGGIYSRWAPIVPALEKQFTVYAVDRRGRGESGDTASYAIEREFEDVAALVDAIEEEVLTTFMSEVVRMLPQEIELSKSMAAWRARVGAAHTLPRELRAHEGYRFNPSRFKALAVPTLLLVGGDSPHFLKAAIETLHRTLPDSRVVILPGQQHIAMETAPDLLVREVLAFLLGPGL